ncbi:unnamed protein product [Eruca vesicaria subsp. sativa]|uniref:Fatty acid hydroxylase domain-containing protein n=1 Tax=Eruca vesicaria subsp. sativa TaxID=29727 RepID=A0ABC8LXW5_ERUVS|nr:unnamed protein product [Eruca vesicaria subsp. sativa]
MAADNRFLTQFVKETTFYNRIILSHLVTANLWEPLPHFLQTWLRNSSPETYFTSSQASSGASTSITLSSTFTSPKQIHVAMKAMPWYTLLPTVSEYMIERGWTKCYSTLDHFNWFLSLVYIALYLVLVEFMIYWVHKELHDIKFLYKHLHATHHMYNKQNTLSPFAGLAFSLLFLEGIWTASIYDCIHGNVWPIMGAGYHTIHHTTYKHNYGHYTIWMDWLFGTLEVPVAEDDSLDEKTK